MIPTAFLPRGGAEVKKAEMSGENLPPLNLSHKKQKSPFRPDTKPSQEWVKGTYDERVPWAAAWACSHSQPCEGVVVPQDYKLAC